MNKIGDTSVSTFDVRSETLLIARTSSSSNQRRRNHGRGLSSDQILLDRTVADETVVDARFALDP